MLLCLLTGATAGRASTVGAPLTPNDAVAYARAHSPALQMAQREAGIARIEAGREKPGFRPDVAVNARELLQGPRVLFPQDSDGLAVVTPRNRNQVEVTASAPIYHAGAADAGRRYRAALSAAEAGLAKAEADLALDVQRAYWSVAGAEAGRDVAAQGVELAQQHLASVKRLVAAGVQADAEVPRAQQELAEAQRDRVKAHNGLAIARANFNRVLGRDQGAPVILAPPGPLPPVPASPDRAIALARERRPEIAAARANLAAAEAGVRLAGMERLPTLNFSGAYSRQNPSAFLPSEAWNAGFTLSFPLLDGGQAAADVREARQRRAELQSAVAVAQAGVELDARSAWANLVAARAELSAAEESMSAAKQTAASTERRFQAGLTTGLEVVSAHLSLQKARMDRVLALVDYRTSAAELEHAAAAPLSDVMP